MNMMRGWPVVVVLGLGGAGLITACGDNREVKVDAASIDADVQTPAERGQYVMNVLGACTFCHTPLNPDGSRDQTRLLAGVDCFFDVAPGAPGGCLSTRNLTNHATGLANVTDTQIKNAFQNGIRTDGKRLAPVMPYWIFHNMTEADADAVVAYLRTVPGVDHTVMANEPPWTFYNDSDGSPGPFAPVPFLDPARDIPLPIGGANNASAMRGRYLTSMAGLCIDCHTPEPPNSPPFTLPLDFTRPYGGGRIFPKEALGLVAPGFNYPPLVITRNLTSDVTGLGGWTRDQIKKAIAEGRDRDNKAVCAATHGGVISPYAALEPEDLDDIVEYIFNLPPVAHDTAAVFCTPPQQGNQPESGTECMNGVDDDNDNVPNDGCNTPCGNCEGPPVP